MKDHLKVLFVFVLFLRFGGEATTRSRFQKIMSENFGCVTLRYLKVETARRYVDVKVWLRGKGAGLKPSKEWRVWTEPGHGLGIRLRREIFKVVISYGPRSECQEG